MKTWLLGSATICFLILAGITGCGQKQNATAPTSQDAQSSDQGTGAVPGAPHVDPSVSPTADPSSPLYGWEKFSSPEGRFSAIFPQRPREQEKTDEGTYQEVQAHLFIASKDPNNAFLAGYYDLSKPDDPKLVLARMEASMVKSHSGKIVSYKTMQIDNHLATEYVFVFGDKPDYSGRARLISNGQRVYALITVFLTAQPHPDECDAFFGSFQMQ
jgi:hypothetical protein